jgi:HPt (histidine-containing phosphotransfer) domain-containing protein
MNTLTYPPSFFFAAPAPVAPAPAPFRGRLVQMDRVVEFIGDDPDTQRQVFDLCLDLIVTNLPQLRQAIERDDMAAIGRLAHRARGSLGMLGLPMLKELGEDIEYHHDDLGACRWHERCEELYQLFVTLQRELEERLAA